MYDVFFKIVLCRRLFFTNLAWDCTNTPFLYTNEVNISDFASQYPDENAQERQVRVMFCRRKRAGEESEDEGEAGKCRRCAE
jgi:hypothetical protein